MTNLFNHLIETFVFEDQYHIKWVQLGDISKPSVMLTHGTPFSSLEWLPTARALQKDYCVYLWDLPGFGASQEPVDSDADDFDVGLATHGRAFAALCSHWGFSSTRRPHVIAHDIGGHAVLRVHLIHSVKYASLCLLDVVAITPSMFTGMLCEYVQNAAFKNLTEAKTDDFVRPWMESGGEGGKRFIRQIRWMSEKHTDEMANDMPKVMQSEDGSPKKLKILWAKNENWIPIEIGERLAHLTGAPEFVKVEEAGHLIQVDQPEIVTYEISSFLAKVSC